MTDTSCQNLISTIRNVLEQPFAALIWWCNGVFVAAYQVDRFVDGLKTILRETQHGTTRSNCECRTDSAIRKV